MTQKILVIAGGKTNHLSPFLDAGKKLNVNVRTASFSDLSYKAFPDSKLNLEVSGTDLRTFDVVYIRLVGKRFEDLSLIADYARKNNIKLVDRIYLESKFARLPLAKSLEIKLLHESGVPIPQTIFGNLEMIREVAPRYFGETFVIKDTSGKQGHGVWSPKTREEFDEILKTLSIKEAEDSKRFIVQEFIKSSQRARVLVVGGKAVAAITRPTKWRRRFIEKVNGEYPAGKREALNPIPKEDSEIAEKAANVLSIDIAGVDILHEEKTGKPYVLEVNSAPRWESIKKDTGIAVEEEIIKYLSKL